MFCLRRNKNHRTTYPMGCSLFFLCLIIFFSSSTSTSMRIKDDTGIKSAHLLDTVIRDYTFQTFDKHFIRTGLLHTVNLPANFSGIRVDTARFRCGSLSRYGAQVNEFHLGIGVLVHPCVERVIIVRQNLGKNWSSIYYDNYNLYGYQLVSPVLGLLAYNAGGDSNSTNPLELGIYAGETPILIDFRNITEVITNSASGLIPLCASFEGGGKVTLSNLVSSHVCVAKRNGHYGLVIESPLIPSRKKASRWRVAIGTSIGAAIGVLLLGLLIVAMFVRVKKRSRMEEMERRAYEEEALQVSMVGHVRAPTAPATRTLPTIEHHYTPPPPPP